ncbi:MAG: DNA polymerase III subunit delta' [Rhodothermales bacterium]|nr:DNA polymerase III subunit delta' [Rhodothermales bacterium]
MAWNSVIGQERAVDTLRRGLEQQRIAHAYLFYGPEGSGKRAAAIEMAKALQCIHEQPEACGECPACLKVSRLIHPDVQVLFPYPGDVDESEVGERLRLLAANPYAVIDFVRRPSLGDAAKVSNKQAIYTVARVHQELRRVMSFKPVEGRHKVAILTDVEYMRVEAANAFLKLLEEPTPRTVFILLTSRTDKLLPTILSRCQRLRFDPLSAEAIEQALQSRAGLTEAAARILARMANGSYSSALELADNEELLANRALVVEFMRLAYTGNIDKLSDQVTSLSALGRERLKGWLILLMSWIRDLLLFRHQRTAAVLVNSDQAETIQKFCDGVPNADLDMMIGYVEETLGLIARNTHVPLTITVLALGMHHAMHGRPRPALYAPLAMPEETVS